MTVLEIIAVTFGLLCVWLAVRQNIWCWPTGLVQVVLYIVIFYQVKLYSDVLLHIVYVGLQIYGWYYWLNGRRGHSHVPIKVIGFPALLGWCGGAIAGTGALGWFMASATDASVPYPDAFTTVASLCAQVMLARKQLQSWFFWIAVDVVAIAVYFHKALFLTAGLYAVFLCLAIIGLLSWKSRAVCRTSPPQNTHDDRTDTGQVRSAS